MVVTGRAHCPIVYYAPDRYTIMYYVEHSDYGLGGESPRETLTICTCASLTACSLRTLVTLCNAITLARYEDPTCAWDFLRWLYYYLPSLNSSIGIALIRPRRLKQYCLQLCNVYTGHEIEKQSWSAIRICFVNPRIFWHAIFPFVWPSKYFLACQLAFGMLLFCILIYRSFYGYRIREII